MGGEGTVLWEGGKKCVECARAEPEMVCTCVCIVQYMHTQFLLFS